MKRAQFFRRFDLVHHLLFATGFHPLTRRARRELAKALLTSPRHAEIKP